jgi:uncharacterized membrane protein YtjA (UPF0391 family)
VNLFALAFSILTIASGIGGFMVSANTIAMWAQIIFFIAVIGMVASLVLERRRPI